MFKKESDRQRSKARGLCTLSSLLVSSVAMIAPAAAQSSQPTLYASDHIEKVVVTGKAQQLGSLKQKSIFLSAYGDKALDRQQLKSAGVVGGAAQALSFAPGISVSGYGQTGGTKASISINGISQGWAGLSPGTVDNGSLAISFDGIPMVNAASGLWETPQIPQTALLEGARVTYGPGDPENRWYNNIGGGINFVPIQPSAMPGGSAQLTYGSFNTQNYDVILQTGRLDGWETVVAGGYGKADNFRTSPDGYSWPTTNYAAYFKTRKVFHNGDVSFGAYTGDGEGWRPVPLPITPVPGLSVNGIGAPGPLLSQQTTGFYSTVNEKVWAKKDANRTWMLWARQTIKLDSSMTLHNQLWFRRGDRLHYHYNNFGLGTPGAGNLYEHNNPFSYMYGDKLWGDINLPYNRIGLGGYFINTVYNSRNSFYNPGVCGVTPTDVTYGYGTVIPAGTTVCGSQAVPNANHRSNFWHITDLALFVQDAITPISSVTITPGFRLVNFHTDYYPYGNTYFAEANALDAAGVFSGHDQGKLPATQTDFTKTEPSINARWQPLHWLALYGNWATAYRLPPVGGGGGLYQSTPALGNILEKGVEYQFGAKLFWPRVGMFSKVLINLNYYHLHFSNQFIGITLANGVFKGLAQGDSLYHGVNLSAEANLNTLKMFANLNLQSANFNNYEFGGVTAHGLPVSDTPSSTFNIGAYWTHVVDGFVLKPRAWYQFVGSQNVFDNNAGMPTNQKLGSHGVLNLALAATMPSSWYADAAKRVTLKIEVMNVLDDKYNQFEYISAGGLYGTATGGYPIVYPGAPQAVYATIAVAF
ncbi:MAG: TonB-dependent receptor [Alphaproteobacteria bacterium]|nr:TonB-dependent receptor [Alphaproteobacteria bacterium]